MYLWPSNGIAIGRSWYLHDRRINLSRSSSTDILVEFHPKGRTSVSSSYHVLFYIFLSRQASYRTLFFRRSFIDVIFFSHDRSRYVLKSELHSEATLLRRTRFILFTVIALVVQLLPLRLYFYAAWLKF